MAALSDLLDQGEDRAVRRQQPRERAPGERRAAALEELLGSRIEVGDRARRVDHQDRPGKRAQDCRGIARKPGRRPRGRVAPARHHAAARAIAGA